MKSPETKMAQILLSFHKPVKIIKIKRVVEKTSPPVSGITLMCFL